GVVTGTFGVDDRIVFTGLSGTLGLADDLPAILNAVVIDGSTAQGATPGEPSITVDGRGVADHVFAIAGPGVAIRSLAIVGAEDSGVLIAAGASDARLTGNHIGIDAEGTAAAPNVGDGVRVAGGPGHVI